MNIEELLKDIDEALSSINEETIDEKIMTKKQARRKKLLRAKRRAEKQARLQAEKEAQQKAEQEKQQASDDVIEGEIVDDGGDDDNNNEEKNNNEEPSPGTALVVYQEPTNDAFDDYTEVTEDFKNFLNALKKLMEQYKTDCSNAIQLWQRAGKDSGCPQEAWDNMNTAIVTLKEGVTQLLDTTDTDKFAEPELILLDKFMTGFNGYIEKAEQEIMAVKPNLVEDDFKAPATTTGTEVTPTDNKSTALAVIDKTNDTETSVEPAKSNKITKTKKSNSKDKSNLVSYERFMKGFKLLNNKFGELLGKVIPALINGALEGAKKLIALALNPIDWFDDALFGFLTSPVAHDFVKTLMYSNPLTAMIFDGKLGKFGISDKLNKLHQKAKNALQKGKGISDPVKANPENYDERHFPKNISKMTLKELKHNLYGNKAVVDCINVSYNHPDVRKQDKADLQKNCHDFAKKLKQKNIDVLRKDLSNIIDTLTDICDYMSWTKPMQWQVLAKIYVKAVGGRTETEQKQIDKLAKSGSSKKTSTKTKEMQKTIQDLMNAKMSRADMVKLLTSDKYNYNKANIEKILDNSNYHESYTLPIIKELNQLIESALA